MVRIIDHFEQVAAMKFIAPFASATAGSNCLAALTSAVARFGFVPYDFATTSCWKRFAI